MNLYNILINDLNCFSSVTFILHIKVDNQKDLSDIGTTSQEASNDEDTRTSYLNSYVIMSLVFWSICLWAA